MAVAGGYVSLSMRDVLADYLEDQKLDAVTLLGPRPEVSTGELARYPISQFAEDISKAKSALNDPHIALNAGQTVQAHHLGVLGYVVQHCTNLAEAQLRLERYMRLIYDGNRMQLELTEAEAIINFGIQHGFHGSDVDDFMLAVLVSYGRRLVNQTINPSRVELVNPTPENKKPYHQFFGREPVFEQIVTRIGMPIGHMLLPVVAPNAEQCQKLDQAADQALSQLPQQQSLEPDLRAALLPMIRRGETKIENLAQQLHCSPRTLQRRLNSEGQQFQDVLDRLRFELAQLYMARPELELVDIALLCGFSEHSAFTRAFTRWAGMPPSEHRQQTRR